MKYKKYLGFSSKLVAIMFIIFVIYYAFCWIKLAKDTKEGQDWENKQYSLCEIYLSSSTQAEKEEIINKNKNFNINDDVCNKYVSYGSPPNSAYNTFDEFFIEDIFLFPVFIPIIVIFPFVYIISREFKNKVITNYCLREDYRKYIKYIFKTAYKNIFFIPIIIAITFLISFIISKGNMNPSADIGLNYVLPNLLFINNKAFPFIYFMTLFLGMGLYINIGLIVQSRTKNFIIALLESQLFIFFIWCFSIIVFGNIGNYYFKINPDNFNLMNLYTWSGIDNMYVHFGFNIVLFIITLLMAVRSYTNKEQLINMCER